ncbi:MAG TPA: hypothetical protein VGE37_16930 [Archangium sp.]
MFRRALTVALGLAFTGCLDVCTRAANLNESFPERHQACFSPDALPSPKVQDKTCDASMKVCSAQDEQAIQRYFDCVESLKPCTPETRSAFNDAFLACTSGMNQLSEGCFRLE